MAKDGYMVYPSGEQAYGLVRGLEELDALESSVVKTSSVACWQTLLKLGSSPPYELFTDADTENPSLYYLGYVACVIVRLLLIGLLLTVR